MLSFIGGFVVIFLVYFLFFYKNDNPEESDTRSTAYTALREIVERVVNEARKLPELKNNNSDSTTTTTRTTTTIERKNNHHHHHDEQRDISGRIYEDLLATAILNKVVEKYHNERLDGNSNLLSGKSSSELESGLDEGVEEGSSSLEALSQDDCSSECSGMQSKHSRNHQTRTESTPSLTIEERIEEVTTYTSEVDFSARYENDLDLRKSRRVPFPEFGMDIIDLSQDSSNESDDENNEDISNMDVVLSSETWEENWLFQKRKIQCQSEPVSMLVPNSNTKYRALIGDKDAEDTSDLSECSLQSDDELEKELKDAINNVIPKINNDNNIMSSNDNYNNHETVTLVYNVKSNDNNIINSNNKLLIQDSQKSIIDNQCLQAPKLVIDNKPVLVQTNDEDLIESEVEEKFEQVLRENLKLSEFQDLSILKTLPIHKTNNGSSFTNKTEDTMPETPKSTPVNEINDNNHELLIPKVENIENLQENLDNNKEEILKINGKNEVNNEKEEIENEINDKKKPVTDLKIINNNDDINNGHHHTSITNEDGIQQESEYTEHHVFATQRHKDSLSKRSTVSIDFINESTADEDIDSFDFSGFNGNSPKLTKKFRKNDARNRTVNSKKSEISSKNNIKRDTPTEESINLFTPPRPGTIAEREHKKWENAIPIENNPYSEENIQKRLIERQYARRMAEMSGRKNEEPSAKESVEIIVLSNKPDIQRFKRDYYINESKSPCGQTRSSATPGSSRPTSSLSQHSNSTCSDFELQDRERESTRSNTPSSDLKIKVTSWQQNNNNNVDSSQLKSSPNPTKTEKSSVVEDFLENERKNCKNEINAKLNNHDDLKTIKLTREKKSSIIEDKQRKIKKIDLKAYGFEKNELAKSSESFKSSTPKRIVKKLDLKSLGYENGLRRSQSINQLDENRLRPFECNRRKSSNLSSNFRNSIEIFSKDDLTKNNTSLPSASSNGILSSKSKYLNKLTPAKSVPNMSDYHLYEEESDNIEFQNDDNKLESSSNNSMEYEIENNHVDKSKSLQMNGLLGNLSYNIDRNHSLINYDNKDTSLPSVKKLAESFNRSEHEQSSPVKKKILKHLNKFDLSRSKTPDVQIIQSPRQMHSITARSLSKEFREGLRQIPNNLTPNNNSNSNNSNNKELIKDPILEEIKNDNHNHKNLNGSSKKLKSNIKFWEKLQNSS